MISREEQQQAMKKLKHMISELKADTATFNNPLSRQLVHTLSVAVDCLEIALSQPERPKGRWEKSICTNCGKDVYEGLDADIWSAYIPPFCPNCGADMRGEEE